MTAFENQLKASLAKLESKPSKSSAGSTGDREQAEKAEKGKVCSLSPFSCPHCQQDISISLIARIQTYQSGKRGPKIRLRECQDCKQKYASSEIKRHYAECAARWKRKQREREERGR